jgi:hypothetical protein
MNHECLYLHYLLLSIGSAELTVTWMAGSSELSIEGRTTYYFLSRFAGSHDLAADINNLGQDISYKTYEHDPSHVRSDQS